MGASSDLRKNEEGRLIEETIDKSFRSSKNIGKNINDFEIIEKLGEGRFGIVYKVKSKITKKLYAMKKLEIKKDNEPTILREIKLLEDLNHPHVINYFVSFRENGFWYIVVEYMNGQNLQDLINTNEKENKYIEEKIIWEYAIQCLSGLLYLHKKKSIVHRDIKPDNLMLDADDNLKISDFGISAIDDITVEDNLKFKNSVVGPRNFFAPEVISNKGYGFKSDIYMLGLTLFYLSSNKYYLKRQIISKEVFTEETGEKIPNIYSDHLKKFILDLLTLEPEKRPDAEKAFNLSLEIYINKYLRATSIMSLFFCFFGMKEIIEYFQSMEIIDYITNKDNDNKYKYTSLFSEVLNFANINIFTFGQMEDCCKKLRILFDQKNKDINKLKEVSLFNFIIFILTSLNKELVSEYDDNNDNNNHASLLNENIEETNEESVLNAKFIKWKKSFSFISNEFFYFRKTVCECCSCNNIIKYKFELNCICNLYPDKTSQSLKKMDINIYELLENFRLKQKYGDQKLYCKKCNWYQNRIYETKNLYTCPPNLIFQINYKSNKFNLLIEETIDITNYVEKNQDCETNYILVGAIFCELNNNKEEIFTSISKNINNQWIYFNGKAIQNSSFNELQNHKNLQYLFYSIE